MTSLRFIILLLQLWTVCAWEDYKDYKVLELQPRDLAQQQLLLKLDHEQPQWDYLGGRRSATDTSRRVLVAPQQLQQLQQQLQLHGIEYKVLLEDLAPHVRAQRAENLSSKAKQRTHRIDVFAAFYNHSEINAYMESLVQLYPKRVQLKTFGWSYEQRALKILTISNGDGRRNKPVIFIDATIHAREWVAPSFALYIIQQLLEQAENADLLLNYDWVIMPVVNADGYEFTHSDSRFWRKTRKPTPIEEHIGTDINRNFGYKWGDDAGSSGDPAEEIYRGEQPFDQPETQVLRDALLHYKDRLAFYLSLHSYGNYLLLPWGHTSSFPDNYFYMMEIADAGAMAIIQSTNGIYSYGSGYHLMYPTSGDSNDFAVALANATVAITMELPAGGFLGFDPWVTHIEGIVTESWVGVRAMALEVISRGYQ